MCTPVKLPSARAVAVYLIFFLHLSATAEGITDVVAIQLSEFESKCWLALDLGKSRLFNGQLKRALLNEQMIKLREIEKNDKFKIARLVEGTELGDRYTWGYQSQMLEEGDVLYAFAGRIVRYRETTGNFFIISDKLDWNLITALELNDRALRRSWINAYFAPKHPEFSEWYDELSDLRNEWYRTPSGVGFHRAFNTFELPTRITGLISVTFDGPKTVVELLARNDSSRRRQDTELLQRFVTERRGFFEQESTLTAFYATGKDLPKQTFTSPEEAVRLLRALQNSLK